MARIIPGDDAGSWFVCCGVFRAGNGRWIVLVLVMRTGGPVVFGGPAAAAAAGRSVQEAGEKRKQ